MKALLVAGVLVLLLSAAACKEALITPDSLFKRNYFLFPRQRLAGRQRHRGGEVYQIPHSYGCSSLAGPGCFGDSAPEGVVTLRLCLCMISALLY